MPGRSDTVLSEGEAALPGLIRAVVGKSVACKDWSSKPLVLPPGSICKPFHLISLIPTNYTAQISHILI
jgi:hypothetical protein